MPVHVNKIGDFEFLSIEGPPYLRQQQLEIIERPGVSGSGLRRLGRRGKEFELVTTNYEESFLSAKQKMAQYILLPDEDQPVELTRNSISEGTFFVLEVRERARLAIFNAVGGFDGGEECLHEVSWKLLG